MCVVGGCGWGGMVWWYGVVGWCGKAVVGYVWVTLDTGRAERRGVNSRARVHVRVTYLCEYMRGIPFEWEEKRAPVVVARPAPPLCTTLLLYPVRLAEEGPSRRSPQPTPLSCISATPIPSPSQIGYPHVTLASVIDWRMVMRGAERRLTTAVSWRRCDASTDCWISS